MSMVSTAKNSVRESEYILKGSILSPIFIILLEALSREFRTGVPWELLYADDLSVMEDSLESQS
jgi:hypothetical protein